MRPSGEPDEAEVDAALLSGVLAAATECSIIATDLDGMITVFNRGAERMLGYGSAEVVGIHTPALIHDGDEVVTRAHQLGIAPGSDVFTTGPMRGEPEIGEWTYIRKDGSRLPVQLTVTALRDDDQQTRGFVGIAVDLSQQREAQAAQSAADDEAAIMESAFSGAPGGVALIGLDGRFLRVNAALCDILGRSETELVGVTSAGFTHPDDLARTAGAFVSLRAEGTRVEVEKRYLRPDGQVVWVSTVGTTLGARDGRLAHVVTHFRDVTEQRLAEEQLRASEENLRNVGAVARELPRHENPRQAICEAARAIAGADVVQLWEPDGPAHLRATTITGEELCADMRVPLTGETSGTVTVYRSGQRQIVLDMLAPNAPISTRMRERLRGASALWEPIVGRGGPLGVLVVIWRTAITETHDSAIDAVRLLATEAAAAIERADATERLSALARKDELRLRQVLEAAPDAMIISDAAGIVQTINDQTERLLGYARDELIGESIDLLVPGAQRAGHAARRGAFIDAPSPRAMGDERRLLARHKDGHEIPVSITLSPVHTDDGLLVTAAVRDITERRLAEEKLRVAEEQFRRSFDDAPIGMTIVDLEGRYLQVNDAFCAILGHSRATLIGLTRQSITHPDDVAADAEAIRGLIAGEARSFTREKRFMHAAGHPVWASINVTLIRDADDRPHHLITQAQDITERRLYDNQLRHMADHDPLTGLLNRRSFNRELASHVARVKRSGAIGAVLMIDLDNFKYYNDTQGHGAGDALIVRIGQALQSRLRETDVVSRLGGDEFAVLLAQEDSPSAEIVAQALRELIRQEAPDSVLGEQRRVTASIGIACFTDGDRLTAEEIMVNADLAMYDAKESGRNAIARYRTDEHERLRTERQMQWATQITQALAEDHFELLAQPIHPLRGGGPSQYELLLRMRDAHGDLIPPGTFLYIAERLGLVREIDLWVVAHAIDLLAEHRSAGRDLRFEINLSGNTLGDPELLTLIERRLEETGVPPDRLIFEITETAAVANIARAAAFADRLSELGCHFALDDFGAGFGSFYYLKHLPCKYLKIDGEYVRHCATNETDRVLIAAVVQIAQGMGKLTIAEFVGDQETIEILAGLGVDYGQGYFLGRPRRLADHIPATATMN